MPSEPSIDPETERRLTALILGEASEFEHAELSRLLASDPELRALHEKLSEAHFLLTASESQTDQSATWKLPEEKREALLATISSRPRKRHRSKKKRRKSASLISAAAALVAISFIAAFSKFGGGTFLNKRANYEYAPKSPGILLTRKPTSENLNKISPSFDERREELNDRQAIRPDSVSMFESPIQKISSNANNVAYDRPFSTPEEHIFNEPIVSDNRRVLAYYDTESEVSQAQISPATTPPSRLRQQSSSYESLIENDSNHGALEKEIEALQDDVERSRVAMLEIMVKNRIVDASPDTGLFGRLGGSGDIAMFSRQRVNDVTRGELQAQQQVQMIETQITALQGKTGTELINQAAALDLKDSTLTYWKPKYDALKAELESALVNDSEGDSPKVQQLQAELNKVETNLENGIKSMQSVLDTQLQIARQTLESVAAMETNSESGNVANRQNNMSYQEAKKRYQAAEKKLSKKQRKLEIAKNPALQAEQTQAALDLEIATTTNPFSTFSLNVSDVSFKLAQAALLKKGEWPDETKIRPEEFVNAFDYADPAPAPGAAVSQINEQCIHPFLPGRNLVRIAMRTAATGRGGSTPLRLTVLLDKSGSMEREDRETSVDKAMEALASQLREGDIITVIGFARTASLIVDRLPGKDAGQLAELVADAPSQGGTNLEEALQLAGESAQRQFLEHAMNRIVLITDGAANLGNAAPHLLQQKIVSLRNQGIAFDACGVGADGLNDEILEALTRKGDGRYYFLDRPEDADEGFVRQLAGALRPAARNVKVQVKFNPARVASYRLSGFEKHRLNKEDFRDDKVDAAELAAAESGNAIYQIEINPEGQGNVGEVFVRFQDTSSSKMVERSWQIPYQPSAPVLADAPQTMQLAALASIFAEKLKGGPLAELVDLSELAPVASALRGQSAKSDSLIEMIEKARRLTQ